jgi:hypothetical protein
MDTQDLMRCVALTRLRRFERVAAVAKRSDSPIWQRLAEQAARAAMRDYLLLTMPESAAGNIRAAA